MSALMYISQILVGQICVGEIYVSQMSIDQSMSAKCFLTKRRVVNLTLSTILQPANERSIEQLSTLSNIISIGWKYRTESNALTYCVHMYTTSKVLYHKFLMANPPM